MWYKFSCCFYVERTDSATTYRNFSYLEDSDVKVGGNTYGQGKCQTEAKIRTDSSSGDAELMTSSTKHLEYTTAGDLSNGTSVLKHNGNPTSQCYLTWIKHFVLSKYTSMLMFNFNLYLQDRCYCPCFSSRTLFFISVFIAF